MSGYTVIDFETTGLFAQRRDRVVEVGVVMVSEDGDLEDSWSTLVDPGRDVGAQHVHGISEADVAGCPTFADIAPCLLDAVRGRTVVAHNARFDLLFLTTELRRAGYSLPTNPPTAVCTMKWSARIFPRSARGLADCCAAAGVTLGEAHAALDDARATADLLSVYIRGSRPKVVWYADLPRTRAFPWPSAPTAVRPTLRARPKPTPRRPSAWMDRIVATMPRSQHAEVDAYLELLEEALLDRYLDTYEEQALAQMAVLLGMAVDDLLPLHRDYLQTMAATAWEDGVITEAERAELDRAAALLGLDGGDVTDALDRAGNDRHLTGPARAR